MIRHIVTYAGANLIARAATFLLLPVYAYYLTPEQMGTAALLWTVVAGGSVLILGNLESAVLRFKETQSEIVNLGQLLAAFLCIICFGIGVVTAALSTTAGSYILIVGLLLVLEGLSAIWLNYLRSNEDSSDYFRARFIYTSVLVLLTVGVLHKMPKVEAVFLAQLAASVASLVYLWLWVEIKTTRLPDYETLKKCLQYSLPLAITGLLFMALDFLDRWFVEFYMTRADVGLYGVIYRLGMIVSVIVTASQLAWTPYALKHHDKPGILGKWQVYMNFTYAVACLMTVLAAPRVISMFNLFPETYQNYFYLLPPIVLSYWVFGVGLAEGVALLHHKKTKWTALSAGFAVVINAGCNVFFIPRWGLSGAAHATLCAFVIYTVSIFVLTRKISLVRYNWRVLPVLWLAGILLLWL